MVCMGILSTLLADLKIRDVPYGYRKTKDVLVSNNTQQFFLVMICQIKGDIELHQHSSLAVSLPLKHLISYIHDLFVVPPNYVQNAKWGKLWENTEFYKMKCRGQTFKSGSLKLKEILKRGHLEAVEGRFVKECWRPLSLP